MYKKLSADPNALIFGIISLVIMFMGCCCGPFVVASIVLSIAGLMLANKSLREYNSAPEGYDVTSKNNVYVAKILNLIALIVSSLFFIVYALKLIFLGSIVTSGIMKDVFKNKEKWELMQDSVTKVKLDSIIEENALYIDTLKVESEKE